MEFPRFVFKTPGSQQHAKGTYESLLTHDDADHAGKLSEGWFNTLPEAIAGVAAEVEAEDDNSPPTRAELEEKAKSLNIAFDGRTSDAKLLSKINEALAEV
jgi:hypothetical protein